MGQTLRSKAYAATWLEHMEFRPLALCHVGSYATEEVAPNRFEIQQNNS